MIAVKGFFQKGEIGFAAQGVIPRLPVKAVEAGDELDVFIRSERIKDLGRTPGHFAVDDAQHVDAYAGLAQALNGLADDGRGRATRRVGAHQVMRLRRSIQRYADEKMFFGKEGDHFVGKVIAVGLHRVGYAKGARVVFLLKLNEPLKKREADQRGLAPLKQKMHGGIGGTDDATHRDVEQRVAHAGGYGDLAALHFVGIEAITAPHVAGAGYGLNHHGNRRHKRFSLGM